MSELAENMHIARCAPRGMITIRADLNDTALLERIANLTELTAPGQRQIAQKETHALAWMSPDELLLMLPKEERTQALSKLGEGLKDIHHLIADVSDARAVFSIQGPHVREVLSKGMPVDLSPEAFQPGQIRRSRLGQVACAIWMTDAQTFELIVFASMADFVENWLQNAARKDSFPMFLTPDQAPQTA